MCQPKSNQQIIIELKILWENKTICKTLLQVKWKLVVTELQRGDDLELDKMLREGIRDGDPMAHLVMKKRSELVLPNLGDNEKMKESRFVVPQDIPDHSWLKRRLDAAPKRYAVVSFAIEILYSWCLVVEFQLCRDAVTIQVLESAVLKCVSSLLDLFDNVAQVVSALCKMKMGMACGG
ncbi:hypothetical protein SO802_013747 [Lithocarpus litseifolius]|uniref:Uncharacterized protein n=1 Tax=Lithocarpus litseifolius TaxID=425828 RepID=A0AAW2DBY8_9ROSI